MSMCQEYNTHTGKPKQQQDCPDSSFTFVSDMSVHVPGAKWSGCIQLGDYPYAYSDLEGKYHPHWAKIYTTSP